MKTLVTLLIMVTLSPTWAQEPNSPEPLDFTQQYPNILSNNIFSRYREPYVEPVRRERHVETPPAPAEETYYVLTGVSREEDGKLIAFIEYNSQGYTQNYLSGSEIAEGKIESLTLDGLVYVTSNDDPNQVTRTDIKLGQNLLGQAVQSRSRYNNSYNNGYSYNNYNRSSSRSTSRSSSASSDSSSDTDAAAMMQELIERRQRELGR